MARVPYVDAATAPPKIAEMFRKIEAGGYQVLNLYRTIGHLGEIGPEFIRLGNKILFKGSLPPALRELAILLVGHIAQAPYEFTKHVEIGRKCGVTQAQIDALGDWRAADCYDGAERAVLAYADEVSRGYRAQDETFAAVRSHLGDEQAVELTVVIGFYEMICRVLEALQVDLEDDFEPF